VSHPIARAEPLTDQVYGYLRQQILTGHIEPGSRIVESKIARELQVSRSPVREAIRLLHRDGLLVLCDGGITLFQPSLKDFKDLYELRFAVEPVAARLTAQHISPGDCGILQETLRLADEWILQGEMDRLIDSNTRFHELIVQFSGNHRLQKVMSEVSAITRYYRYFVFKIYHRRVTSVEEHWRIFSAIQQGMPQEAERRMREHIENDLAFIQSMGAAREEVTLGETIARDSSH
jgi:DNA-binding GntR family transcriptional regulator